MSETGEKNNVEELGNKTMKHKKKLFETKIIVNFKVTKLCIRNRYFSSKKHLLKKYLQILEQIKLTVIYGNYMTKKLFSHIEINVFESLLIYT